jgi:hypothetical protein
MHKPNKNASIINVVKVLKESFLGQESIVWLLDGTFFYQVVDVRVWPRRKELAYKHQLTIAVEDFPRRFRRYSNAAWLANVSRMPRRPSSKIEAL